ncbi:hypothetical protein PHMEG_00029891, partial [Phytophthora megakarya]
MSMMIYERFVKNCPEAEKAVRLEEPLICKGADGQPIEVKMTVNLHLKLTTVAGTVRIAKPVECLVIPGDSTEFLLGNDVLTMLGIDVLRQLDLLVANTTRDERDDEFDDVDEAQIGSSARLSEEVLVEVEKMVDRAVENGFPKKLVASLHRIATRFDLWRLRLGDDPPARVSPMKIRLKPGAKPYRCKARKYPPEVRKFLDEFNDDLVKLGWRVDELALPFPYASQETSYYKPVNAVIEAIVGVMPNLQVDIENVEGARFFGLFDFIKGYWQLALAEECQEWLSYMAHRKVYTPRRVPQGCTDAALFFQSTIQKCLEELLHKHLLVWIDDLLLYARDARTYLVKLERLFELLDFFGFKLSPKKSCLFAQEVRWCGKLINGDGVQHDPERVRALQAMPFPRSAGELQQFLCATNWMRDSLIDYARVARPLQDLLDDAMSRASKRTKRVAASVAIELSAIHREAFDEMKAMLSQSVILAHPKPGAQMCVLTDASDIGWSLLVTQVENWQPKLEVWEQAHEMLICLSGTFTGAQRNWSIIEKEAYPIVCACDKLSYLLLRPDGFKLYCDHRNLIYVFAPGQEVKKHIRGKLLRWSTKLMEYHYEIEHIDGESNVWADMVSRWAGNHDPAVRLNMMTLRKRSRDGHYGDNRRRRKRTRRAVGEPQSVEQQQTELPTHSHRIRPLDDPDFEWPTWAAIRAEQVKHAGSRPVRTSGDDAQGWYIDNKVWIPAKSNGLIQRMLVVAHCGSQGHRGRDAMLTSLRRLFLIDRLRERVDTFLANCLLCKHVKGGKTIQRPWGETYRNNVRNGALHFDFLSLGDTFAGDCYLLVLKDEATHFTELTPCADPTSGVAVEAILAWHSRFGAPPVWISDQGSHFTSEVVAEVCRRLKASLTVTYSPWINGSVERANRDIIQVLRALCLEYKVNTHDWTYFVPVLQASLNHTPVPSLGNRAPVELFCGLPPATPLTFCVDTKQRRVVTVPVHKASISKWLDELKAS